MAIDFQPPEQYRQELVRIQQAFTGMPYGGIAHFVYFDMSRGPSIPEATVEQALRFIADNIESLQSVLRSAAKSNTDLEAEHNRLVSDLKAVGRLIARFTSSD